MLKSLLGSLAALSLAVTPVAAQAGTRAAGAVVSLQMGEAELDDDDVCHDNDIELSIEDADDGCGGGWWWLVGGAIVLGLVFVIAGDLDENNASPGAN